MFEKEQYELELNDLKKQLADKLLEEGKGNICNRKNILHTEDASQP
jgi:hypothetical protein